MNQVNQFELKMPVGANRKKRCLGRGKGTGLGASAGKGTKGQKARAGGGVRPGFEGGQTPLFRRLPRRGFKNEPHRVRYVSVNLDDIERVYNAGETVNHATLVEKGLVRASETLVKILGRGKLTKKLSVQVVALSESAKAAVTSVGGTVVE